MTSTFGWLAIDPKQRRRMMEAVDQFRDETTLDDLGFGAIRDAFSNTLFPGVSSIQTRLRYVLFIPWLLQEASHRDTVGRMQSQFREAEFRLITALQSGKETVGVIGRDAGRTLQRLPSEIYWVAIGRWGLVESGFSARRYFERELLRREELKATPRADDPDVPIRLTPTGLDPRLPPPPEHLLRETTFALRPEDARYLREAITRTAAGSLFAHLVTHRPENWTDETNQPAGVGDPAIRQGLPPELEALVDRATKFALYAQGANLLYNLLVAEATHKTDQHGSALEEVYTQRLGEWFTEVQDVKPLHARDRELIWQTVIHSGRRLSATTKDFVGTWADAVANARAAADLIGNHQLRCKIVGREREKKGPRARLTPGNQLALDAWGGASGTGRFDYLWTNARRHLQDLYDAEETA
ncbi:DUF6361 family protein [Citricoccus muralis]|uniref:Uncharacterized protein n=1 Tax=Citricoccus muralis TaxID=169134 RepID=A0A3D9LCX1_9MICC|nr:DUF6361 family protein [Citricoccus muralis]REE04249.1 hypothetical protein C8E99_2077 [Citricoccus muralis]